jgi:hypothetical protein
MKKHDIRLAAYGSLMSLSRHPGGPVDGAVDVVLNERNRDGESEAEILLMWARQVGGGLSLRGLIQSPSSLHRTKRHCELSHADSNRKTSNEERMINYRSVFSVTSSIPPLSDRHVDLITRAGASAPYRKFGQGWPYFVSVSHTEGFAVRAE